MSTRSEVREVCHVEMKTRGVISNRSEMNQRDVMSIRGDAFLMSVRIEIKEMCCQPGVKSKRCEVNYRNQRDVKSKRCHANLKQSQRDVMPR